MKPNRLVLSALLLCAAAWPSNAEPPKKGPDLTLTLARVNGEAVTAREIVDTFSSRHSGHAKFLGGDLEARKFLNIVIEDKLLVQEAYEIGLDQDAAIVELTTNFANDKVRDTYIKRELTDKVSPTKEEVAEARKNLNVVFAVRQIALRTREEAEQVRTAILNGAELDKLARTCSFAESARNGGHLIVNWGQMEPEWERVVFALEPGEVSPVIETRDAYEVVYVDNRVDVALPELAKVSAQIESALKNRKLAARKKELTDELWTRYHAAFAPIDRSAQSLRAAFASDPKTVVATWDNGGKATLEEIATEQELKLWSMFPPRSAQSEIDDRIRATVNNSLAVLEGHARKYGEEPELAKELDAYRDYLMEALLFRDHIFKEMKLEDAEVRAYYDAHKAEFEQAPQLHVAQILTKSEADAKAAAKKLAAGVEFSAVVKELSRDPISSASGGDLGWITPDKVPSAFQEVLTLKPGEVSKPIRAATGDWHLIRVLETQPKRLRDFEEVRAQVKERVTDQKKKALRAQWVDKLRAASKIEIDDSAIQKFVASNQFDETTAPPQHAIQ